MEDIIKIHSDVVIETEISNNNNLVNKNDSKTFILFQLQFVHDFETFSLHICLKIGIFTRMRVKGSKMSFEFSRQNPI